MREGGGDSWAWSMDEAGDDDDDFWGWPDPAEPASALDLFGRTSLSVYLPNTEDLPPPRGQATMRV